MVQKHSSEISSPVLPKILSSNTEGEEDHCAEEEDVTCLFLPSLEDSHAHCISIAKSSERKSKTKRSKLLLMVFVWYGAIILVVSPIVVALWLWPIGVSEWLQVAAALLTQVVSLPILVSSK